MRMRRNFIFIFLATFANIDGSFAQTLQMFVSQSNRIQTLKDANGDSDFLDAFEVTTYVESLPCSAGPLAGDASNLFMACGASVLTIVDLNGDGDAMDFNEVQTFSFVSDGTATPNLTGLLLTNDGSLLATDIANGTLIRFVDQNGDGDAFDFNEAQIIASGFNSPNGVVERSDGKLIVSQNFAAMPLRILNDMNGDGDFFDFAENISYAESQTGGIDYIRMDDHRGYHLRPSAGRVMMIHDVNSDNDALDFGEAVPYAESLASPSHMTFDRLSGSLFVATANTTNDIVRLSDLNGDGDALDFAEKVTVATGLSTVAGMLYLTQPTDCIPGDVNGNGSINVGDLAGFVNAILNSVPAACPFDMNEDGLLNGQDIPVFIEAILE